MGIFRGLLEISNDLHILDLTHINILVFANQTYLRLFSHQTILHVIIKKYPWKVFFNKQKCYGLSFCRFSESKLRIFRLVKSLILQTCVLHMQTCFLKYVVAMSSRYYPGLRIRVNWPDPVSILEHKVPNIY